MSNDHERAGVDELAIDPNLAILRAANPIPVDAAPAAEADRPARPSEHAAAADRFRTIVATDPNAVDEPRTAPLIAAVPHGWSADAPAEPRTRPTTPSLTRHRRGALAAAAAAVAAITFGASTLLPGSTPAAAATVIKAAEQTERADSGSVELVISVRDDAESVAHTIVAHYEGDDLAVELGPDDAADLADGLSLPVSEVRVVDDVIYANMDGTGWIAFEDDGLVSMITSAGLPSKIREDLSGRLVEIVKGAEGIVEVEPGRYRGTTTVDALAQMTTLIPGSDPADLADLPEEASETPVDLELVLSPDGAIDLVTLASEGEDTDGVAGQVEVTIDFDDLDPAAVIEAPADAENFSLGESFDRDRSFGN